MARIWVDCTNSPHAVIFRPLVAEMERRGHEVTITARDFAQTLGLLERYRMPFTAIGHHRGRSIANKVLGVWSRGRALARWAKGQPGRTRTPDAGSEEGAHADGGREGKSADTSEGGEGVVSLRARSPRRLGAETRAKSLDDALPSRRAAAPFDLAVSHGSNDLPFAAWLLGIPHVTMFDYEHAALMHHFNIRLSARVIVPEAIPEASLSRYGLRPGQLLHYKGLKEEYYLADFEPDASVLTELDLDPAKVIVTLRTPPSLAAYHRTDNPYFLDVVRYLNAHPEVQQVILARTPDQRAELVRLELADARVPERTIDAQSLVHYSDLVVSAGGTINREAVALGTPVFTMFEGRMGAVDDTLIAEGRMARLSSVEALPLVKKSPAHERVLRDPRAWVDLILGPPMLPSAPDTHG